MGYTIEVDVEAPVSCGATMSAVSESSVFLVFEMGNSSVTLVGSLHDLTELLAKGMRELYAATVATRREEEYADA